MNKTVATLSADPFELQLIGDYVRRRFSSFTNDASVKSNFLTSLRVPDACRTASCLCAR
ncbi:hypothetical protein [Sphingobium sp. SCG-1]|uniref:hypothetical protein n=1 Tax=Sphingobium sp. SCG-1 TaxID=2072936 RepID=UPI001CB89966|nr:hypothetical protein [Sphingobium sp. SCG-1]